MKKKEIGKVLFGLGMLSLILLAIIFIIILVITVPFTLFIFLPGLMITIGILLQD